ncbi:unnamed protein product [Ilex paraguariensis]|uniref:Cytochrome P450 n=1 Tax=Ilex paraguariensis TaxID=185542 RepID=A0ABC8RSG0_9AQUA
MAGGNDVWPVKDDVASMDLLSKSHQIYGPVVKLWLGPTQLLVSIKDPELIKEMLLQAEDKLPLTGRAFRLAFGRSSLFVSSFDKVKERRNSLASELNGKLFGRAIGIPARVVDCVMDRIQNVMARGGLDCAMVSQHLAFTILGATLFGDEFLAWSKATVYEELLMNIAKDACFWASYSVTPFWKQGFWRFQHFCSKLKCLTQDIIQHCRQHKKVFCEMDQSPYNETKNTGGDPAFLWEFDGHLRGREESCGDIVSLMFHGSITTAGLIGNILASLVTHPDIQDKIHSEIIIMRKGSQEQDRLDVDRMPFLLATVYESARLLPAGPLLQRCSLKHDLVKRKQST